MRLGQIGLVCQAPFLPHTARCKPYRQARPHVSKATKKREGLGAREQAAVQGGRGAIVSLHPTLLAPLADSSTSAIHTRTHTHMYIESTRFRCADMWAERSAGQLAETAVK